MSTQSEAADLMVKESIQITESAVRLSGLGAKNLAALLIALSKDNGRLKGKTTLKKLLREGRELKVLPMKIVDLKQFRKLAKEYGVLFTPILQKEEIETCDILVRAEDIAKINRILQRMDYGELVLGSVEDIPSKNYQSLVPQESGSKEQGTGRSKVEKDGKPPKQSIRKKLETYQRQQYQKEPPKPTKFKNRTKSNEKIK